MYIPHITKKTKLNPTKMGTNMTIYLDISFAAFINWKLKIFYKYLYF